MDEIDIKLEIEDRSLAELSVKKGKVEMSQRKSYTQIDCKLRDILILDLYSGTHYKKVNFLLHVTKSKTLIDFLIPDTYFIRRADSVLTSYYL